VQDKMVVQVILLSLNTQSSSAKWWVITLPVSFYSDSFVPIAS